MITLNNVLKFLKSKRRLALLSGAIIVIIKQTGIDPFLFTYQGVDVSLGTIALLIPAVLTYLDGKQNLGKKN